MARIGLGQVGVEKKVDPRADELGSTFLGRKIRSICIEFIVVLRAGNVQFVMLSMSADKYKFS